MWYSRPLVCYLIINNTLTSKILFIKLSVYITQVISSKDIAIAAGILKGDKAVKEGYKKFLSGGSSLHPIDLLKLCRIDMEKREVVQSALNVFNGLLDEWDYAVNAFCHITYVLLYNTKIVNSKRTLPV